MHQSNPSPQTQDIVDLKEVWTRPELRRMCAGSAEDGVADNQIDADFTDS